MAKNDEVPVREAAQSPTQGEEVKRFDGNRVMTGLEITERDNPDGRLFSTVYVPAEWL